MQCISKFGTNCLTCNEFGCTNCASGSVLKTPSASDACPLVKYLFYFILFYSILNNSAQLYSEPSVGVALNMVK